MSLNIEQTLGKALQAIHDSIALLASNKLVVAPTNDPYIFTLGTPKGADARKRKDGEDIGEYSKLVQVFAPAAAQADRVWRIEVNDRIPVGSPEFYAACILGAACYYNGETERMTANGLRKTFYGDGFSEKAASLGLAKDKASLTADGEAFAATIEDSIEWPEVLRARFAPIKVKKGGAVAMFTLTFITKSGKPVLGKDGEPLSIPVPMGKTAAGIVEAFLASKGGKVVLTKREVKGEAEDNAEKVRNLADQLSDSMKTS